MQRNAALTLLSVLVLPALAAAGCSGGSAEAQPAHSAPSSGAPAPSSVPPSASPASASAAAPSSAVPSSPSGSASARSGSGEGCASSALRLGLGASNGGAGHDQLVFTLHNASTSACTLTGYPSLKLVGDGGDPLPTHVVHGHAYSFPDTAPKPVTLAPGATASFDIDVSPVPTSGEGQCPAATALRVTPPGATKALLVRVDIAPCGHGTVHVSPVVAGSSGV